MGRILLVEDEAIIREPFTLVLKAHNYDLDTASNGNDALELYKKNTYDLILLDIIMPICNGVEFLQKSEIQYAKPKPRVVMLTNLASSREIDLALRYGADSVILKAHMTPSSLIELVEKELNAKS